MTPEEVQAWRKQYWETTEALEKFRAEEIRALTDERVLQIMRSLEVYGKPWRDRPDWSGLVEQQAIFHNLPRGE